MPVSQHSVFTGRMPFLLPNQQRQSTEGIVVNVNCPFPWTICTPSNTWFLGPIRVPNPNGILISSAVFAWLAIMADRQPDRPCNISNNRPHLQCSIVMPPKNKVFGRPFVKRFALCYDLSVCPVCDVGVLWPNRRMDQDETSYGGRPRLWPRYVRCRPSYPCPQRAQPPIFGPCLLWPNGWMDQDATWYEGRPRPTPHCV